MSEDFISAQEYKFKTCPFCGEYPEIEFIEIEEYCLTHHCHIIQFESEALMVDTLLDLWNTREGER